MTYLKLYVQVLILPTIYEHIYHTKLTTGGFGGIVALFINDVIHISSPSFLNQGVLFHKLIDLGHDII